MLASITMSIHIFVVRERERVEKSPPVVPLCKHIRRTKGVTRIDFMENEVCIKLRQKKLDGGCSNKTCSTKRNEVMGPMPWKKQHGLIARLINHDLVQSFQPARSFRFWDARMPNLYCKNVHPTFGNKKSSSRTSISKGQSERIPNRPIHRSIAGGLLSPASSSASVKAGSPGARLLFTCSAKGAARCDMKLHPNEKRQMMKHLMWGSEIYNFRVNQAHNQTQ